MSKIEWTEKTVPGYDGYRVTPQGEIRGPSGKIMRSMKMPSGHLYVLCNRRRGCQRKLYVHRAVLLAFVGLPQNGQESRHINGDPTNNKLENLCWGTRQENQLDRRKHGTAPIGEQSGASKLTETDVLQIRSLQGVLTLRELAANYGVSHTAIRRAMLGITWSHLGDSNGQN